MVSKIVPSQRIDHHLRARSGRLYWPHFHLNDPLHLTAGNPNQAGLTWTPVIPTRAVSAETGWPIEPDWSDGGSDWEGAAIYSCGLPFRVKYAAGI
jgi:hypothetical protein